MVSTAADTMSLLRGPSFSRRRSSTDVFHDTFPVRFTTSSIIVRARRQSVSQSVTSRHVTSARLHRNLMSNVQSTWKVISGRREMYPFTTSTFPFTVHDTVHQLRLGRRESKSDVEGTSVDKDDVYLFT